MRTPERSSGRSPAGHSACGPALDQRRAQLYVCNRFHNDVSVMDLSTGTELTRIPVVREPIAAAVSPNGRTLLVANHLPDSRTDLDYSGTVSAVVTAIDTRTHQATAIPLSHGASSVRGLCITPDGSYALVTHLLSNFTNVPFRVDMGWINVNVVSMIDLRKRDVIGTIGLDELQMGAANPWDVAVTADGSQICVAASGTHELCVINTSQLINQRARRHHVPVARCLAHLSQPGRESLATRGLAGQRPAGCRRHRLDRLRGSVLQRQSGRRGHSPRRPKRRRARSRLGPPPALTQQRRGQMLFDDATICYQSWQSCASCHPDARADALNWDSDERRHRKSQEFQEHAAGARHASGHVQGGA